MKLEAESLLNLRPNCGSCYEKILPLVCIVIFTQSHMYHVSVSHFIEWQKKKNEKVKMERKWSFIDITFDILWFPNFNLNANSIFFDFSSYPLYLLHIHPPHTQCLLESCEFLIINFFSISFTIYIHSTYLYSSTERSYQWKLMLPYRFTIYSTFMELYT